MKEYCRNSTHTLKILKMKTFLRKLVKNTWKNIILKSELLFIFFWD